VKVALVAAIAFDDFGMTAQVKTLLDQHFLKIFQIKDEL
jgi:hypothetical protein